MDTCSIGIMHGRLSPPFEGRFQAFPATTWREEFAAAQQAGLHCIEWIYEQPHRDENPIISSEGIEAIQALSRQYGVAIKSICADYFMTALLLPDGHPDAATWEHLDWLVRQASRLGITRIVLPFVDSSSLQPDRDLSILARELTALGPVLDQASVELHLETDLPPAAFAALLADCPAMVKANYDTGNSAALGYDVQEEMQAYGHRLGSVHIKDRVHGGGTVEPGTGDTHFPDCFRAFTRLGYDRPYILQTARGEPGNEVDLAIRHKAFVESGLREVQP